MPDRAIKGGQHREQAAGEQIDAWTLDVSDVGSAAGAVTNPDMKVTRLSDGVDVTATVTSGAMGVAAQIITMLAIGGLVGGTPASLDEGEQYRVNVIYDKDGHTDLNTPWFLNCPDEEP